MPLCIGERQHNGRDFAEGPPLVLPVDIDLLAKDGVVNGLQDVPHVIKGKNYRCGVVFIK